MNDARALTFLVAVLVVTDLVLVSQNMWWTVPVACVSTVLILWIARGAGLSAAELGLSRSRLIAGAWWGLAAAAVVAAGYVAVAVLLGDQAALDDDSMPITAAQTAARLLVVIPLRTVLLEELAFRGVLWTLLRRRWGVRTATWWTAVAFGLWHVPAGLRLAQTNEALGTVADSPLMVAGVVTAIVLFTAAASVLFTELRRRSGSLVAPGLLHWATNGIGTVVSVIR